jgi:hypothetical protein
VGSTRSGGSLRGGGVALVHEQQIHVARVVQLDPAELAEPDHREPQIRRHLPDGGLQAHLGDGRDLRHDVLDVRPGEVTGGDPHHGATSEAAEPVGHLRRIRGRSQVAGELPVQLTT